MGFIENGHKQQDTLRTHQGQIHYESTDNEHRKKVKQIITSVMECFEY